MCVCVCVCVCKCLNECACVYSCTYMCSYMSACMHGRACVYIFVYLLTNTETRAGCNTRSILTVSQQVWMQNFLSPWQVTIPKLRNQICSAIYSLNSWIHTFPMGISCMWNANNLVQDLYSGCCLHFQWDYEHLSLFLFGLVLWHINHCRLLMPNPFLYIQISLSNNSV